MGRLSFKSVGACCALVVLLAASTQVQGQTTLTTTRIITGLDSPVYLTSPPGDTSRIFIIEQDGRIRILVNETGPLLTFLDIDPRVGSSGNEQGLLGLAFDPDFDNNGFFYVDYTNNSGDTVISRFTVSPPTSNSADDTSEVILKTIDQPEPNHNGGYIDFGPDGMLYVAMGDGGGANDAHGAIGNGQSLTTLLGKLLRLDVNNPPTFVPSDNPFVGTTGLDEIWAYGLRNPWRFSFDRANGDIYIADVGQNAIEEVDYQPASSTGGENYGWRCREGSNTFINDAHCADETLIDPIHEYNHAGGRCSITGGYVYRGSAISGLQGTYFFADFCSAQIWSFRYDGANLTEFTERTSELVPDVGAINLITSFGEDADGELFILDRGGELFKIIGDLIDCNENGIEDADDIAGGTSDDCNNNLVPDECDVEFGGSDDCNNNDIPDECDVAGATSDDCNANITPDECEADCNFNGVPDDCDISGATSNDCQPDGQPDECQTGGNDCNANSVPDECDLAGATSNDCNTNSTPDECDPDCDNDGIPDVCDSALVLFTDDFENDLGWTVTSEPGTAGVWERGEPQQTTLGEDVVQPGEDNPLGSGTFCYVTNAAGGAAGTSDVDGGPTRLMSPQIDMSAGSAVLSYAYWMYSALGTGNDDEMVVEASNDDGSNWTIIATHDVSASLWRSNTVLIDDFISPTDMMRIRFRIEDTNGSSFTEGLVDDVVVTGPDCPAGLPDCEDHDVDCSGTTNAVDIGVVRAIANFNTEVCDPVVANRTSQPRSDVDRNGNVNAVDIGVIRAIANFNTSTGECNCLPHPDLPCP